MLTSPTRTNAADRLRAAECIGAHRRAVEAKLSPRSPKIGCRPALEADFFKKHSVSCPYHKRSANIKRPEVDQLTVFAQAARSRRKKTKFLALCDVNGRRRERQTGPYSVLRYVIFRSAVVKCRGHDSKIQDSGRWVCYALQAPHGRSRYFIRLRERKSGRNWSRASTLCGDCADCACPEDYPAPGSVGTISCRNETLQVRLGPTVHGSE
ncbi:hypothetical protein C8R47DRAFT_1158507 [Mycena vitilis]|nr:hypothetical protein C8R47DRAFT_1158507 [Mycena vitilis]